MSAWKNGHNERTRTCDECPFCYENFETDSWGCEFFGEECVRNKKFDDDICYVHPKKLQNLAKRRNKRLISLEKECWKYRPEYRKPVTSNKFIQGPYNSGYEVIANADFLCTLSKHYRPNMKGGHTHNHIYNKCHKHIFRSKQARKNVDRNDKPEFVRIFFMNLKLGNYSFDKLLHTIFHHNKRNTNDYQGNQETRNHRMCQMGRRKH